jgi:hypothetical protein
MLCSSTERLEQISTAAEQSIVAIMYDGGRVRFDISKIVFPTYFEWNVQKEKAEPRSPA